MTDDELLDLYKESQFALGHGETPWAVSVQVELEREMCRALSIDVWDRDMLEAMLDELHVRAFPDPTRPPRLEIEAPGDPREDY
jgi:hypothetical protein